LPLDYSSF